MADRRPKQSFKFEIKATKAIRHTNADKNEFLSSIATLGERMLRLKCWEQEQQIREYREKIQRLQLVFRQANLHVSDVLDAVQDEM